MFEGNDLVYNFFTARQWAKHQTDYENGVHQIAERPWAYYESGLNMYDDVFFSLELLGKFSFRKVIEQWTSEGLVLEAFGEGTFVRELIEYEEKQKRKLIKGGAAVTLADIRTDDQQQFDNRKNVTLLAGDLYLGSTYGEILKLLNEQGFRGFKLIVCHPLSGWDVGENGLNPPIELVWVVLRRLYSLLEDGGELFISLPVEVKLNSASIDLYEVDFFWDHWIAGCKERNIEVKRGYGGNLRIIKNSKQKLPRFSVELLS